MVYSRAVVADSVGIRRKPSQILRRTETLNQAPLQLWDGVLRRLGAEISTHTLDAWVRPLEPSADGERLRLICPSAFHRERVRVRLLPLIHRHAAAERGEPVEFELILRPPLPGARAACEVVSASRTPRAPVSKELTLPAASQVAQARESAAALQLELPYRFENFISGGCNALAREAGLAVARGAAAAHQSALRLRARRASARRTWRARSRSKRSARPRPRAVLSRRGLHERVPRVDPRARDGALQAPLPRRRAPAGARRRAVPERQARHAARALAHRRPPDGCRRARRDDRRPPAARFPGVRSAAALAARRGTRRGARAAGCRRAARDPAPQGVRRWRAAARRLPGPAGRVGAGQRARARERADPARGQRLAAEATHRHRSGPHGAAQARRRRRWHRAASPRAR